MGKLSFTESRFIFVSRDSDELNAAQCAGFQFYDDGLFVTRAIHKAVKLRPFADHSAELKFKTTFITSFKRPDNIPYPDHLEPKSFQIESAWHCVTRSPAYCADEAGLGKTVMSSLCMNAVPGKVLIICPPFLKYNWKLEINKWAPSHKVAVWGDDAITGTDTAVIVPDSVIARPKVQDELKALGFFRWMFVDEAHRFKEEKTKRTQALITLGATLSERLIWLSGTPILNRAMELYPLLSSLAPEAIKWRTKNEFGEAFCNPRTVEFYGRNGKETRREYLGLSNPLKLRDELYSKLMIRHRKKDVLLELPEKTRGFIFIDQPNKIVKYEKAALKLKTIEELIGEDAHLGDIATYRKESGLAMIKPALEIIKDILDQTTEPLIVAAHHRQVVRELFDALKEYNPVDIIGGMSAINKQLNVEKFQNDKSVRVLVGNIDAMGVGLTLTRAQRGLTIEPSWVPGINEQMEDRIHRITQKGNVYWQYLLMRGSLNERILWKVLDKQQGIEIVMS